MNGIYSVSVIAGEKNKPGDGGPGWRVINNPGKPEYQADGWIRHHDIDCANSGPICVNVPKLNSRYTRMILRAKEQEMETGQQALLQNSLVVHPNE